MVLYQIRGFIYHVTLYHNYSMRFYELLKIKWSPEVVSQINVIRLCDILVFKRL